MGVGEGEERAGVVAVDEGFVDPELDGDVAIAYEDEGRTVLVDGHGDALDTVGAAQRQAVRMLGGVSGAGVE